MSDAEIAKFDKKLEDKRNKSAYRRAWDNTVNSTTSTIKSWGNDLSSVEWWKYNTPVWGDCNRAADAFCSGQYLAGTGHLLMAFANMTMVGELATGIGNTVRNAVVRESVAAKTSTNAARLSTNGVKLNEHLYQLEKYGTRGYKTLQNGRIRYYGEATLNRNNANSFRMVREWNPATGGKRTWFETLNPNGGVIQVRPELGTGVKTHYLFDGSGGFLGTW